MDLKELIVNTHEEYEKELEKLLTNAESTIAIQSELDEAYQRMVNDPEYQRAKTEEERAKQFKAWSPSLHTNLEAAQIGKTQIENRLNILRSRMQMIDRLLKYMEVTKEE